MFSSETFLLLGILLLAAIIYLPIVRLAKKDMAERNLRGESSTSIMMLMLIPVLGPLIYLAVRKLGK